MKKNLLATCLLAGFLFASDVDLKRAEELYQHTDYAASLKLLSSDASPSARALALTGRNLYMLGEYKKATEAFQKASALEPNNSGHMHWLGRCYGRRAETASPLLAPVNASKARQAFERAIELDPRNQEAMNDLFDYYIQAPGFLGGGLDKAEALAKRIGQLNPAEYHYAAAQLEDRKKHYDGAEDQFRRAIALAPRQVGRVVDLARYLAKQGRIQESDAAFRQAEALAPNSPKVLYAKAHTYIEQKRNLEEARVLLQRYLQCNLTPEDPSREQAKRLLKQASGD